MMGFQYLPLSKLSIYLSTPETKGRWGKISKKNHVRPHEITRLSDPSSQKSSLVDRQVGR